MLKSCTWAFKTDNQNSCLSITQRQEKGIRIRITLCFILPFYSSNLVSCPQNTILISQLFFVCDYFRNFYSKPTKALVATAKNFRLTLWALACFLLNWETSKNLDTPATSYFFSLWLCGFRHFSALSEDWHQFSVCSFWLKIWMWSWIMADSAISLSPK